MFIVKLNFIYFYSEVGGENELRNKKWNGL